jgi:hypothetical protein
MPIDQGLIYLVLSFLSASHSALAPKSSQDDNQVVRALLIFSVKGTPISLSIWRVSGGVPFNPSNRQTPSNRDEILQATPKGIVPEGEFTSRVASRFPNTVFRLLLAPSLTKYADPPCPRSAAKIAAVQRLLT